MSTDAISAIRDTIAAGGLSLTAGTNLFLGMPQGPDSHFPKNAVFVAPSSGPPPQRFMGQASEIRYALVEVRVRWTQFGAGNQKALDIQKSLQGASISGYLDVEAMQSMPAYNGRTEDGYHLWFAIFSVVFEETP